MNSEVRQTNTPPIVPVIAAQNGSFSTAKLERKMPTYAQISSAYAIHIPYLLGKLVLCWPMTKVYNIVPVSPQKASANRPHNRKD